jgi:hypothetical protein
MYEGVDMGWMAGIERRRTGSPRRRARLGAVLLVAAVVAGCSGGPTSGATPSPTGPAPTGTETTGSIATATAPASPTEAPIDTDAPVDTDTPGPSASPMPTLAGRSLVWQSIDLPKKLSAAADSAAQNAIFGFAHGYLAFRENVISGSAIPWLSSDGTQWQEGRTLDMTGLNHGAQVDEVVDGPAGLLALGRTPGCADDGTGCTPEPATALWTSVDGLVWSRVDLGKAFGGAAVGDVSAGPKGYMAVSLSTDDAASAAAVWLSSDGQNWHSASLLPATFQDAYLARGTVLSDGFLLAGRIGSVAGWGAGSFPWTTPAVWWSADGAAWSRVALAAAKAASQAEAAVTTIAEGKLVAHVGSWDCTCPPDGDGQAWTSSDGRTWKAAGSQFPSPAVVLSDGRQALQVVASDAGLTVAVSSDGFKWARVVESGSGPADLSDEAYGPGGLLVEDSNGGLWLAVIG